MIERPPLSEISKYVPSSGLSRCAGVQSYYRPHSDYGAVVQPSSLKAAESMTSLQPANQYVTPVAATVPAPKANSDLMQFIEKQEGYIEQLERESQFCRVNSTIAHRFSQINVNCLLNNFLFRV